MQVQVHELSMQDCAKCYVFRGAKEYQPKQIQEMLGLSGVNRAPLRPGQAPVAQGASR